MAEDSKQKLTPGQKRAIEALLSTKSVREAAEAAELGERTVFRYLGDPFFRQQLSAAEGDLIDQATRRLLALQGAALDTFEGVLANEEASDTVRLRAAQSVLDSLLKLRELRNIEARLVALESAIGQG